MARVHVHAAAAVGLLSLIAFAPAWAFEYSGDEGPAYWHELDAGFAACAGPNQSPIDLRQPFTADRNLGPLDLDLHDVEIRLENNGHTIEQEYGPGSTLTFAGVTYGLLQFHFHTLSEHTVRGKRYPMEMHAVFRDDGSGNLAVIGQLFKIRRDGPNAFLDAIGDDLPEKKGDEFASPAHIQLADALENTRTYYTYPGSLTTPPCSPIVTWIVLRRVASMTRQQFEAFRDALGNDFRPLQDQGGRTIRRAN